jgi:antitoxin component YwqK of YwqJK toxin-antitoxin module
MKLILCCLLFCSLACTGQQSIKRQTFYDYAKTKLKEVYLVSPTPPYLNNGYYKLYNQTGILIKDCVYKNGKLNGPCKEMYSDGSPKLITSYSNDLMNGLTKEYFPNGVLKLETVFRNGVVNGKYIENYENGKRNTEAVFENGKENGVTKHYYDNGNLNYEREMVDGTFHGYYKEYYPSGILKYDVQARNGKKEAFLCCCMLIGMKFLKSKKEFISYCVTGSEVPPYSIFQVFLFFSPINSTTFSPSAIFKCCRLLRSR